MNRKPEINRKRKLKTEERKYLNRKIKLKTEKTKIILKDENKNRKTEKNEIKKRYR